MNPNDDIVTRTSKQTQGSRQLSSSHDSLRIQPTTPCSLATVHVVLQISGNVQGDSTAGYC